MKGLKISFEAQGASLVLDQTVADADCEIQNALVNVGTARGSDPMYPLRGTNMLKEATSGAVVDLDSARHVANFAALYTFDFIRSTLPDLMKDSPHRIVQLKLSVKDFDGVLLDLSISGQLQSGVEFGYDSSVKSSI